jgi:asparagine synthase (glutamine-hydrolysing)
MCGIAGIVAPNGHKYKTIVEKMVKTLHHRGPDAQGFEVKEDYVLGHARLSIVDIATGQQPMKAYHQNHVITFNGEIYGYREIKKKISNYPFKTNSDTEVILALYDKYGSNLTDHLPGIFAFAIYDHQQKKLTCARDRFGEKPFYYAIGNKGEFIFASEIKAILATGLIEPTISKKALNHYLKKLYIHPSETIYQNIHVLPPAHRLVYTNGKIDVTRYWHIPPVDTSIKWSDAIVQIKELFERAVEKQLIADVPVAAFLSGGIDSTSVVYYAKKLNPELKTFSFGFGEFINEIPAAQQTAGLFKTNHTNLYADDFKIDELILEMARIYDEPLADSSTLPSYLISKEARKHVKVVLTGDGGDELLAGYAAIYNNLLYFDRDNGYATYYTRQAKELIKYHHLQSVYKQHLLQNNYFNDNCLSNLTGLKSTHNYEYAFNKNGTLADAMNMDLLDFMPGDILVKTDRASMANGLELRAPFLDVDFASFCIKLPAKYKLERNEKITKWIFKQALNEAIPQHILSLPKQGFQSPIRQWLKSPAIQSLLNDYVFDANNKVYNLISYNEATKHFKGDIQLWTILTLSIWYNHNFLINQ